MTVKPNWFKMKAENGIGYINILGEIGMFGTDFPAFDRQLAALGPVNEIKLKINSDGGEVHTGFAIYNALAMHPAKKTVTVMGIAASMASVVFMAGDKRVMPSNAMLMIHNPVGGVQGESDEIIAYGEAVGKMRGKIAETYSLATDGKLSQAKALSLMDRQSWLTAQECLANGLCTEVTAPVTMTAKFDLSRYGNVPKSLTFNREESIMTTKNSTAEDAAMFEDEATRKVIQDTRAAERKAILAQQKEVNSLCRVAGRVELAAKFNEDGKTVSEVIAELDKLGPAPKKPGPGAQRAARAASEGEEVSAHRSVDIGDEDAPIIDSAKIYDDYNHPGRITARKQAARDMH